MQKRNTVIKNLPEVTPIGIYLAGRFTYLSESDWESEILNGKILINGKGCSPADPIQNGDTLTYFPPERPEPPVNTNYSVIYEDNNLLLINKPADLPCHPGGIYLNHTLWALLKKRWEDLFFINRLDRETSGILGVAKNRETARFYYHEMKNRSVQKDYLVMVEGLFPPDMVARGWLVKDLSSKIRKKRLFVPDHLAFEEGDTGDSSRQYCHTDFTLLSHLNGDLSLLKARLHTGKTHQIRATLHSLGYPVVGDKLYGIDPELFLKFPQDNVTKEEWKSLRLSHQALHSWRLGISLPEGDTVFTEVPPPESWQKCGFSEKILTQSIKDL